MKFTYELMQDIGQEKLALRFYQLYESLRTGRLIGTGAGRIDLYMISIKKFLKYPILGYKLKGYTELYTEIGLHSQILDTLAGTGIIGFSLACFPFLYVTKKTGKYITDRIERYYFKIGIAILFIFMLTNPTSYSAEVYMVVFCLPFWINGNKNIGINAVEVKK